MRLHTSMRTSHRHSFAAIVIVTLLLALSSVSALHQPASLGSEDAVVRRSSPAERDQVRLPTRGETPPTKPSVSGELRLRASSLLERFTSRVEAAVDLLGDKLVELMGLEEDDFDLEGVGFEGTAGLAGWSESSIYVERTNALHPSRPSSFGPHLTEPLHSFLYPITIFDPESERGCSLHSSPSSSTPSPPAKWVALIERGKCPFSHKVRTAMALGAEGVVFGDMSVEEGGVGGIGGLLTPWSPDDTSDITIPSTFVSRASYRSLLQTWNEEQTVRDEEQAFEDDEAPTPRGLTVVMSKDEMFAWPLLDLLLLLLFLPSLLTLITVFTQRIRMLRQQKLDRAPQDIVDQLPVFLWSGEKLAPGPDASSPSDEERNVGVSHRQADEEPTESTSLLPSSDATATPSTVPFFRRIQLHFPAISHYVPFRRSRRIPQLAPSRRAGQIEGLTECAICLSDFERGEEVMLLPCGHLFHKGEIVDWLLKSKRVCPVCRASITVDDAKPSTAPSSSPASATPSTAPAMPIAFATPVEGQSNLPNAARTL